MSGGDGSQQELARADELSRASSDARVSYRHVGRAISALLHCILVQDDPNTDLVTRCKHVSEESLYTALSVIKIANLSDEVVALILDKSGS